MGAIAIATFATATPSAAQTTQPASPTSVVDTAATRPSVYAPPASAPMEPVIVTANRLQTPQSQVGSAYTVIGGEEIERRQQPLVADVLRTVPGLDVARSGGNNQITSVFLRGAESSHTLVLIDGVEANDPSSPNRAFDFSTLTADNVEKIEVLRGPQSSLWGSNAMGGVINVVTKRGKGPLSGYVFGEYGSYDTYREGLGFSGSKDNLDYSFTATQQDSDGFSAASERFGGTEDDGYSATNLSSRLGLKVSEMLDVSLTARYNRANVALDDFGGPGGDDPDRQLRSEQAFFRLSPRITLAEGRFVNTFGLGYTYFEREDNDETFPDEFDGSLYRFDYQGDLKIGSMNTLSFGLSADEENFASQTTSRTYADSVGVFIQDSFNWAEQLFLTAGLRYEDHSISDSAWTYRLTAAYYVLPATRAHGSYGTGFKTPSLSNLFSSFGDPDLEPEEVQGWDVGVTQGFFDDRLSLDATFFRNRFDNLIDFDFVTSTLQNVGNATTQGIELTLAARPIDAVRLAFTYTYTDTLNLDTDQALLRRAPHKMSASAGWQYSTKGNVDVTLVYNGNRADIDPVSFGRTSIGAYTLLNVSTSYAINDHLTIFGRVENVLDQDYEEVAGFGTAAVSVYGGLKLSF